MRYHLLARRLRTQCVVFTFLGLVVSGGIGNARANEAPTGTHKFYNDSALVFITLQKRSCLILELSATPNATDALSPLGDVAAVFR